MLKPAVELGDKRALNYTGYSLRKSGRVDEGISYYMKALAADPNYHAGARISRRSLSYLGRLDLAEEQLKEIETRCNATCDTYILSDQIEDFRERQRQARLTL
ncbi:MAG: tetratricopeptide repeat protein [Tepidamorphaceae bacterium]